MSGESTAEALPSVSESGGTVSPQTNNVAKFAALLKSERAAEESGVPPEPTPSVPVARSNGSPQLDREALLAAYDSGDEGKLAELLGKDPKSIKVTNSRWAEFRRSIRAKEDALASERQQIEQQRAQLQTEREQLGQSAATLKQASEHLRAGDYGAFIEAATGKPLHEVLETLTKELVDPSQREIRRLRAEQQAERERREQSERQWQQQQQQREAEQARANYVQGLRNEIEQDPDGAIFLETYGAEFVTAVFELQRQSWDGKATISTKRAVQKLIDSQIEKHTRFSETLNKRSGKVAPAATQKKTEQGTRGTRLTSRSVEPTRSQGGASTTPRELTKQEQVAYFANQLRLENAARDNRGE